MQKQTPHLWLWSLALLAGFYLLSLYFKLPLLYIGAPYTTIDDNTLYEAAFLVWFGEAPPQRTYVESWLAGISVLLTYLGHLIGTNQLDQIGLNVVADAYRLFTEQPEPFVHNYRLLMLAIDLSSAGLVYLLALQLLEQNPRKHWYATLASGLFLLSYNSIWCYLVARPDTATAFFSLIGFICYYRSEFGKHLLWLIATAIALGIATGFKLHAAMAAVFITLDLWRHHGLRQGLLTMLGFSSLALVTFLVATGSTLFDPLLYIKLRALNIKDDASPWIQWGEQIRVVFEGTGWLIIPLLASILWHFRANAATKIPEKIKSALFISGLFILVFMSIRQLRAYWMLPALPLFYVVAVYQLSQFRLKSLQFSIALLLLGIFSFQCLQQVKSFEDARYNEMQDWVKNNVAPDEPIYIIGYDTLFLPCNNECLGHRKYVLERLLQQALADDEPFTLRHIRLWEERARLKLIDMLNATSTTGYSYYGFNQTPADILSEQLPVSAWQYVFIMPNFDRPGVDQLVARIKTEFDYVTRVHAPGGKAGTGGLPYDIYKRKLP